MFALTVDTDISSSDFLIFGRLGNREQCFSGSFTFFIFRCERHASSSVFTVIFDATLSLSIFSVCDESMQLVSQKLHCPFLTIFFVVSQGSYYILGNFVMRRETSIFVFTSSPRACNDLRCFSIES